MCCHFKGCCSSPSQPALAAFGLLPRLQHPAWLVSPLNPSCSFPVVLLAEGMLRWGGGLLPLGLSSPYYISLQPNTPGVW